MASGWKAFYMDDSFDELDFFYARHVLVAAQELGQCEHVTVFQRWKDGWWADVESYEQGGQMKGHRSFWMMPS
jgi:hypothetical protein